MMTAESFLPKKIKCINASTLKVIAVISMFIDHVAAGLLLLMYRAEIYPFGMEKEMTASIYDGMRNMGRLAFPIYCYLLVEGLLHTKNVLKYMANLGLFGVISEFFFDITLRANKQASTFDIVSVFEVNKERVLGACNVYFTLLIGLIVIWSMKYVEDNLFEKNEFSLIGFETKNLFYFILYLMPAIAGAGLAHIIHSDYRAWGIGLITFLFVFRKKPEIAIVLGYLFFMNMNSESWSLPAFILLLLYTGKQGNLSRRFKYFFYPFYPAHLFLIYIVRCAVMWGK